MRRLLIIGIGAGDPEHITVQAIKALNRADVFFIPDKGAEKAALRQLRLDICARFIEGTAHRFVEIEMPKRAATPNYRADVTAWHAEIAEKYARSLCEELTEDACGALLVWGDPALYDSTLRIIENIRAGGLALDVEVIPGISSVQALAARHGIPLNRIGEPVLLTTGRRLAEEGFPERVGSAVVLLDGGQAFRRFADEDFEIHWGAYLGTEQEILVSGRLANVAEEIAATRERAREENGWIMDTYLLRRPEKD